MTHPAPRVYGQYFASLRNAFAFEQELPPDREEATDVIKAMFGNPSIQARCFSYLNWHKDKGLFKAAHVTVMRGKVLFLSLSGRWGMSAREGDRVVLLQGFNIPYLVREADDGAYSLVDECYIHGGMDRRGGDWVGGEWREISLV
jgi:glycine cleavage system protein P-like pyridoxal-binding family